VLQIRPILTSILGLNLLNLIFVNLVRREKADGEVAKKDVLACASTDTRIGVAASKAGVIAGHQEPAVLHDVVAVLRDITPTEIEMI
jgi:hypothetical protein